MKNSFLKQLFLLTKYQLMSVIRAKWLIFYALFFFVFTGGLLFFGTNISKTVASLLSVALFIIPLISTLYSAIYWYNSESFHSILLSQPIRRSNVFFSSWISISLGLVGSYLLGSLLAVFLNANLDVGVLTVLLYGAFLSFIFVGIGLFSAVFILDKLKGIGFAFLLCLYLSIFHDILILGISIVFKEYPLELPSLVLMAINPIDLIRTHVLLNLNMSVMMGYTGRILNQFLSSTPGYFITGLIILFWCIGPVLIGAKIYSKRDLK